MWALFCDLRVCEPSLNYNDELAGASSDMKGDREVGDRRGTEMPLGKQQYYWTMKNIDGILWYEYQSMALDMDFFMTSANLFPPAYIYIIYLVCMGIGKMPLCTDFGLVV